MMFGRTEIADAYLEPGSASDVARRLNRYHNTDYFTVSRILSVWADQYRQSFMLRQLGERPLHGFSQGDDKVTLAKTLMAAA